MYTMHHAQHIKKFSAADAKYRYKYREIIKNETYDSFYSQCVHKILRKARLDFYYCWYYIPPFKLGKIVYDHASAAIYVKNKLLKAGFRARIHQDQHSLIFIDWMKPLLDIKDDIDNVAMLARNVIRKNEKKRISIYERLFSFVINKIKIRSSFKDHIWITIPPFKIGLPKYNMENVISYIKQKLIEDEYHVMQHDTFNNVLLVKW